MQQRAQNLPSRRARYQREGGYLLLAILLMMAFMVVTLTYVVAPSLVQQMKRDREEEMIHRGTEYARAIKKFYKKNGRYPASLDDLDKGQIRFLRQRFKDPLAKDGKWKLLHYGDIQSVLNTAAPGTPAAALGQQGSAGAVLGNTPNGGQLGGTFGFGNSTAPGGGQIQATGSPFGGGNQQFGGQNPGSVSGFPTGSNQGGNPEGGVPTNTFGSNSAGGSNQQGGSSDQQGGTGNQPGGTTFGQNSSGTNQVFGGGAIVGVASVSKEKTIRIYNKKKTYDEWQFIYNPAMDQQNVLLRGPYQPTTIGNTNIGTPASQLNGQQQGAFGQQNNGFGQQNNGFGQSQQPGTAPSPTSSPQY